MSRLLALIASLAACQPFYRDDLRAGRTAKDTDKIDKLLDDAERAVTAGDLSRATELARDAIRINPKYSARGYVVLANAFTRNGNDAAARAVLAYGEKYYGSGIRYAVIGRFAGEDRIAAALDYLHVTSLADAKDVRDLDELIVADSATSIDEAMKHYAMWLAAYGVPDHSIERDAVARITTRIGAEIDRGTPLGKRLVAIGPHANAAAATGDLAGALMLYGLAVRLYPADKLAAYRGPMARAAAKVTEPAKIDPVAWNYMIDGEESFKAGKLGPAIHAYRKAVASAPWWSTAHANLAEVLTLDGRTADAALERAWATGLAAGGWAAETADTRSTDLDGDGAIDPGDRCPYEPEDRDGFEDTDGCPEPDNDHDGFADAADKCPLDPEDKDGFEDTDGCADLDNDRDGIPDARDACPMQPETINGTQDTDGCPDEGRVVIGPSDLTILDPIDFEGKTAKLTAGSLKMLDAIVATLAGRPQLSVEVGVHGNIFNKPERDGALTRQRADAVVKYLVDHGIAAARLTAVGYGDTKPLDPGKDPAALAKNRRVELHILGPNPAAGSTTK